MKSWMENIEAGVGHVPTAQQLADMMKGTADTGDVRKLKVVLELIGPSAEIGVLHQYERMADAIENLCNAIMERLDEPEEGDEWKA